MTTQTSGSGAPAEDAIADAPFDAGLEGFEQVAVQTHEDGLGLRVAEAAVELEHLGAAGGHHQAAVKDAGVGRALCGHAGNHRAGDVAHQPIAHVVIDEAGAGVGAHASGVGAGVAISDAFVVLRGNQRCHPFAVADDQKADLLALRNSSKRT